MTTLGSRFDEALLLAHELHRQQVRKLAGDPYIGHLLAVAALVIEHGGDEDECIAALLHDAVEDQGGLPTLERIRQQFGPRVAEIVHGCTDSFVDTTTQVKLPWRQRKEHYVAHVRGVSASVRLVSASDKLHNARSIVADLRIHGPRVFEAFAGKREGTLWYYQTLVATFAEHGCPPRLLIQLQQAVAEMTALAGEPS